MNGNYMLIVSLLLTWTSANFAAPVLEEPNGVTTEAVERGKQLFSNESIVTTTEGAVSKNETTLTPTTEPPTPPTTTPPTTTPPTTTITTPATTTKTTTASTTTTTSTTPSTTTSSTTPSTTSIPTTLSPNTTSTVSPVTTTESPGHSCRRFDGPSFIGGIILTVGLSAIAFVAFKFYKARNERNYHTL